VQQQSQCSSRPEWAFWDATRLIGMDLKDSTITEFPFFTFLFADLHAHGVRHVEVLVRGHRLLQVEGRAVTGPGSRDRTPERPPR